jgi:hypothetical protein
VSYIEEIVRGIIVPIIVFFLCQVILRYWNNANIKRMRRRIEEVEAQKAMLDELAKSERAVLLLGFQGLFGLLAIMNLIFVLVMLAVHPPDDPIGFLRAFWWLMPAGIASYLTYLMQRVAEYPRSAEQIEKKIAELKSKLTRDHEGK